MDDLISRKWLMECVDEGWIMFDTEKDKNKFIHIVRDTAPSAQSKSYREGYQAGYKDAQSETAERTAETAQNVSDEDLISRKAAIDATWFEPSYTDPLNVLTEVRDRLKVLPSANPEQQWIPVTERLPDIKEHHVSEPCIVYCENGAYGFAELEENIFGQVGWNCERDDEYHEPLGEVIAWMPLPDPYREDDHETD